MSAVKATDFFRTVTFRLTVGYAVIFTCSTLTIFGMIYATLSRRMSARADQAIRSEMRELISLGQRQGVGGVVAQLAREQKNEGPDAVAVRVMSAEGRELAATDSTLWGSLEAAPPPCSAGDPPAFATTRVPGHSLRARIGTVRVGRTHILQVAQMLADDDRTLAAFREETAAAFGVILLVASLGGWFLAHRAMAGVQRITRTALQIERGDLTRRVPVQNEGAEIAQLARAFNAMVARVQSVVTELKEVTHNIAHDLRSPITRMRGLAETTLAAGAPAPEAYRELAAEVVEESDRLIAMINTMLEIAEAESGVAAAIRAPVDLGGLLRDAADLFQPLAEERDIRLALEVPDQALVIAGDVARLQRVVANLLDNAIKYTPPGGTVRLAAQAGATRAILSVADSGPGIAEKDLPHVFERFYRGDASRSSPGNGLGLCLALSFVRAHGGTIEIETAPGHGSRFVVSLPRGNAAT